MSADYYEDDSERWVNRWLKAIGIIIVLLFIAALFAVGFTQFVRSQPEPVTKVRRPVASSAVIAKQLTEPIPLTDQQQQLAEAIQVLRDNPGRPEAINNVAHLMADVDPSDLSVAWRMATSALASCEPKHETAIIDTLIRIKREARKRHASK